MNIEQWARVRRKVLLEKPSKRAVMLEEGLQRETLQKLLSPPHPPAHKGNAGVQDRLPPQVNPKTLPLQFIDSWTV